MKKVLFIAVAALAFAACGNNGSQEQVEAVDSTAVEVSAPVDSCAAAVADSAAVVENVAE